MAQFYRVGIKGPKQTTAYHCMTPDEATAVKFLRENSHGAVTATDLQGALEQFRRAMPGWTATGSDGG